MTDTGTTKGLLVPATAPGDDNGNRPIPDGLPFWATPNVRLATGTDATTLIAHPESWETIPWDGTVDAGTDYRLLVRVRNTDQANVRHGIQLQGWVSDFTVGGVGPQSAILTDPTLPFSPTNLPIQFNGFLDDDVPPENPAAPGDPAGMRVLQSAVWKPTNNQATVNAGHVCVGVNVYQDATSFIDTSGGDAAEVTLPPDGGPIATGFLSPTGDRKQAQRNIMIVMRAAGATETRTAMLLVPAEDRCPLLAEVTLQPVAVAGGDAALARIPELAVPARTRTGGRLAVPGYQYGGCGSVGHGHGDHHEQKTKVRLNPGDRIDLDLTFRPARGEKPGDVQIFDAITEDLGNHDTFGAARIFVMVTDPATSA